MARRTPRTLHQTLAEPHRTQYLALEQAVAGLSDPVGDVLALVTEEQLASMLERLSRKNRTAVLQELRTPAVGQPSTHAVRQALAALRRSEGAQQTYAIGTLTQPTLDGMQDGLSTWLEQGADRELAGLEELAPDRTVLLLTGLVQWRVTHLAVPLLHLVLRDHPLSSWPAESADAVVRACQAFEETYRNRPAGSLPVELASEPADQPGSGEAPAVPDSPFNAIDLSSAAACAAQAERLRGAFVSGTEVVAEAALLLAAGRVVPAELLRPAERVRQVVDEVHMAVVRAGHALGPLPGPDLPGLLEALEALGAAADQDHALRKALRDVAETRGPEGHPAVAQLHAAVDALLAVDGWAPQQVQEAGHLAAVAELAHAVESDDDDGADALTERLRQSLPPAITPVLTLILRGKAVLGPLPSGNGQANGSGVGQTQDPAPRVPTSLELPPLQKSGAPLVSDAERLPEADAALIPLPRQIDVVQQTPVGDSSPAARSSALPSAGVVAVDDQLIAVRPVTAPTAVAPTARKPDDAPADPPAPTASPVLADLTGRGQLALAHHAARALGHHDTASALRALALAEAMRSDTGACAHELRAAVTDQLQQGVPGTLADQLIMLAAAVRSGLLAGDPDSGEFALKIAAQWHDLPATDAVATAIGHASARGQLSGRTTLNVLAARPDTGDDLAVVCDTARAELRGGPNLNNLRAKQFADRWWAPDGRIGTLLHAVADDRRELAAATRQHLRELGAPGSLSVFLDRDDKAVRGTSRKLQNAARSRILQHAANSLDIVQQWLVLIAQAQPRATDPLSFLYEAVQPHRQRMIDELTALTEVDPKSLTAAAARACLASLETTVRLLAGGTLPGTEPEPSAVLNSDLLRAPDLDLNAQLTPSRAPTLDDVAAADRSDWAQAVRTSIDRENYAIARIALDALEQTDTASPALTDELRATLHTRRAHSGSAIRTLHGELARDIDTAIRMGRVPEPGRARISARMEAAHSALAGDALGAVRRECEAIREELTDLGAEAARFLQERATVELNEADAPTQLTDEVRQLIVEGDLATAEEYLLAAREGNTPPRAQHTALADFNAYFPAVPQALPEGITPAVIAAAENGSRLGPLDFGPLSPGDRRIAVDALSAWHHAATRWAQVRTNKYVLRPALRLAGIEYVWEADPGLPVASNLRRWVDLREVTLIGKVRLPAFGTQADGRLRLLMTSEVTDAAKLLAWVQQDLSSIPVVIAFTGTLSPAQRRALAAACAERPAKPVLVLDAAALAYLASRGSGQFTLTERILAPFSAINPYTPDANEAVPEEMFYGRGEELSAVTDQHGVSLLYGGRRLGKSALLRAAGRRHALTEGHIALYLPLPSSLASGTEEIWDMIFTEMGRAGIGLAPGKHATTAYRRVRDAIAAWLDQDRTRRLLLLLDECDSFFDAEADAGFPQTTRLRNLMSSTERRFKPVFAGLHQVQRFAGLPNQPLAEAHFGRAQGIGPLSPGPAYRLLQEPAEVLGINFAHDSLIHRLLAYCNYHPKLLQVAGEALVTEALASRTPDGPPWTIDNDILERVIGSPDLRRRIRDTVRLNLNLDPRYKVIALLIAHNAHTHGVEHNISTRTLRQQCADWWPESFTHHTADEFRVLLEEMVGLGILATERDGWRLRSSNVLRLLGTPDAIEEELHAHDPNDIPTRLSISQARRPLPGARISPLTEQQIAGLVRRDNALRIVLGTDATCLDDVITALADQQQRTPSDLAPLIKPTNPNSYRQALSAGKARGPHRLIISDMRAFKPDAVDTALRDAITRQPASGVTRCVIALINAGNREHLEVLSRHAEEDILVPLQRATADGIRSWVAPNEVLTAFNAPENRRRLFTTTGGWPILLNQAADLAATKHSAPDICRTLHDTLATPAGAGQLLEAAALTDPALQGILHDLSELDEPLSEGDLVDLLTAEHPDAAGALTTLRHLAALTESPGTADSALEKTIAAAWRAHGPG
ncbi:hypothetical protein [Streptomyces sp. H39-S7]|uniref:hypothetical protein n=1 Tax=Streptomyces sp. H39-S7 TaxID=3004357 RepID=UPI0022AFD0FF|nr:hypothetical protein [Streptomyces sp. H39-S7]MCZ4120219.1 hypothetical protein [Streptomyces sp. H39-S7]